MLNFDFQLTHKQTIAIDLDEVLAPFVAEMIPWHNQKYNTAFKFEQFTSYDFSEIFDDSYAKAVARSDEFHESRQPEKVQPLPGAKEALTLLKSNYRLILVTSRPLQHQYYTEAWVHHHLPNIFTDIVLCNHWTNQGVPIKKSVVCKQFNASYLIDDLPQYINDVETCNITGLLFGDYPWNQNPHYLHEQIPGMLKTKIIRLSNWQAVINYFNQLNN